MPQDPTKFCNGCKNLKNRTEFCHPKGNNLQYEFATCNNSSMRLKNKRIKVEETSETENINITLCYWHLEHAISRKLKEKKSKAGTYTETKALEAHRLFDFIDQSWIPINNTDILCPDESTKELLNMVKKHANMHPLIPLKKDTFLTSMEIYQLCVQEVYEFCHSQDLRRLWSYLWMSWYDNKNWNLFARSSYPVALPMA